MSKHASRVDLAVPFAQKDEAKKLGTKWDAAKRVWYAPSGEKTLIDRWGSALPSRKKQRRDGFDFRKPEWTVSAVRHGPCGKEIVIDVGREPWDPPES